MQIDFTQYFVGSDILNGRDMAVFRALLYFNLPKNIVFKPVKPVKVFSAVVSGGLHNSKTLRDLTE